MKASVTTQPGTPSPIVTWHPWRRAIALHLSDNVKVEPSAQSSASLMSEASTSLCISLAGSIVLVYLLTVAGATA